MYGARPPELPAAPACSVRAMAACTITFSDGQSVDVEGELQAVIDDLHEVASRRVHSFAVMQDPDGRAVAVRPEAVLHVRPAN